MASVTTRTASAALAAVASDNCPRGPTQSPAIDDDVVECIEPGRRSSGNAADRRVGCA
jgi:hypothetical protein